MPDSLDRLTGMLGTMTPGRWKGHHGRALVPPYVTSDTTGRHLGDALTDATEVAVISGPAADAFGIAALHNLAPELIAVAQAMLWRDERGGHNCRLCGGWHAARWWHDQGCSMLQLEAKLADVLGDAIGD